MRVALIACEPTPWLGLLHACLEELEPGSAVLVDADLAEGGFKQDQVVELDAGGVRWNGVALDRMDAVLVAGFVFENPVLPPVAPRCDWGYWQARHVVRQQAWSLMFSVLSRLEAAGPRLYNPISTAISAFARGQQLDRLRAAGIAVPELLCTNDGEAAAGFMKRHGVVVWRPTTGGAAWQLFRDKQRRHLAAAEKPPVLLAGAVRGPVVKAYVVDGAVVLAHDTVPPTDEGLERFEILRPIDPARLPDIDVAVEAVKALGLGWAAVTLVAGPDGPVVYDVDPDPVLEDQTPEIAGHLIRTLASALLSLPAEPLAGCGSEERPTLLLRRMLRIQFEMERTKAEP